MQQPYLKVKNQEMEESPESEIQFDFEFRDKLIRSVYTPDSIFVGLTKIGAIVALTKVFVLFSMYHEYRFEKRLQEETAGEEEDEEEERMGSINRKRRTENRQKRKIEEYYTFERFREMGRRIGVLERENRRLKDFIKL
jgi:hypothetical protein